VQKLKGEADKPVGIRLALPDAVPGRSPQPTMPRNDEQLCEERCK